MNRPGTLTVACFDAKPFVREAFAVHDDAPFAWRFVDAPLSRATVAMAEGATAVCVFVNDQIDEAVVETLHCLDVGLVALRCCGYDNVDVDACRARDISVVRVPAYSSVAVAEHAMGLLLAVNRRIHLAWTRVRASDFRVDGLVGTTIRGKTVGVVGAGRIGRCLIDILRGFGCHVLACARHPDHALARVNGFTYASLDEILTRSDVVSLHVPLTPETHHLIDATAITAMKPGAILINTARGAVVDTAALIDGLASGRIAGAGLDVYEHEAGYFFEDHSGRRIDDTLARLIAFDQVVLTSHQGFLTAEALGEMANATRWSLIEYANGKRGAQLSYAVSRGACGPNWPGRGPAPRGWCRHRRSPAPLGEVPDSAQCLRRNRRDPGR